LDAYKSWFELASQNPAFQAVTTKPKSLPPIQSSRILTELKVDSLEKWDYFAYLDKFMISK